MRLGLRLRGRALSDTEVVVLGGGPAGCAAATLLARRSHRVVLVRPDRPGAPALAESVPPSARRVLEELGAIDAIGRAGFHPNLGNAVRWAGGEPRAEVFEASSAGFHTDRSALESVLSGVAEGYGVDVRSGLTARSVEETERGWRVRCTSSAGPDANVEGAWLVDATGRRGVVARTEGRRADRGTTTLALVRRWRRPGGWPEGDRNLTFIESWAEGWAWSVPLADDLRCYTVMIDQREVDLSAGALDSILDRELDRTRHIGPSRGGAEPDGPTWACPASLYTATRFGRPGLLLAGDAGSFIDPLSSFGVKKALSSGWLAGIVAHTALVDPAMTDAATAFFDQREREVYRRYRAASLPFFAEAADHYRTRYWLERAEAARRAAIGGDDDETTRARARAGTSDLTGAWTGARGEAGRARREAGRPGAHAGADPDAGGEDVPAGAVREAFDVIRARPTLGAVRGPTLRVVEGPGIAGHRIVMESRLATDGWPDGLRYIRGVDLLTLVDAATAHDEVPDGWTAYNAAAPAVTLPDYLTALATAFAAGILQHRDG